MTKFEATRVLAEDGIDWTASIFDLVDTLTYGLSEARPDLSWSECIDRADAMAHAWAE